MATFASLKLHGIIRLRQSLATAFAKLDAAIAPKVTTDATQAITLTAATHFTDAQGHIHREATLYSSSATAVTIGFAKAQSDLLPVGSVLNVVQSAGACTITGSGGLTVTARGVIAGGRTARAHKVTAALWLIDYPALSA